MKINLFLVAAALALNPAMTSPAFGQTTHQHPSQEPTPIPATTSPDSAATGTGDVSMTTTPMPSPSDAEPADLLMRQASGTSTNPRNATMPMRMFQRNDWTLMLHGSAFITAVQQTGARGGDKLFATNWFMGMADRKAGNGHLAIRSMLSLEPLTITGQQYPLLFQTGETAHGAPIHDGQHPHDFFMELAVEYARPVGSGVVGYIYLAPVGDPALGPVAFPHRASAAELPQAPLGHHVEDSTHIAFNVVTAGVSSGIFGAAISGFHGAEPDENRWDIEGGSIDSWAARLTFDPAPSWSAQISTGHLTHPERLETGDIQRSTASVSYSLPFRSGIWSSSLIFGHNEKEHGQPNDAWTLESTVPAGRGHFTARLESVDRDELFSHQDVPPSIADANFTVRALTAGYTRDFWSHDGILGGIGANLTIYDIPAAIRPFYGTRPIGASFFVRLRNASDSHMAMNMPGM